MTTTGQIVSFWTVMLFFLQGEVTFGGKILIWPYTTVYNSRIHPMCEMGEMLNTHTNHQVTLLLADAYKAPTSYKVHDIMTYSISKENTYVFTPQMLDAIIEGPFHLLVFAQIRYELMMNDCDSLLRNTDLTSKLRKMQYDVFISDAFNDPCFTTLAEYLDVPLIVYSNCGFYTESWFYAPLQLGSTPNVAHRLGKSGSFVKRLHEVVDIWLTHWVYYNWYFVPGIYEISKRHNYTTVAPANDVTCSRVSMVFINTLHAIDYPRPHKPHVKFIGGFHLEKPKRLPHELETFIKESGDDGVIIMSYGSMYMHIIQKLGPVFANVFDRLQQRVVWSFPGAKMEGLPENILQLPWFPQKDLLGHNKTRLFITHCGQGATQEAIYTGVPVLAIPATVDQLRNADRLCDKLNMGVQLDFRSIEEENLYQAISQVLNEPKYKQNARKATQLMRDVEVPTKQLVTYWVDYVIRYKGAKHLTDEYIRTCDMSLYRYFQVDVLGVIILFSVAVLMAVLYVCSVLKRLLVKDLKVETKEKSE